MRSLNVICESRAHCAACREAGPRGDRFRGMLAAAYHVPAGWPACPHDDGRAVLPPGATCTRCHSPAHAVADCPIPPDYAPTPANATAGGCGCSPPPDSSE